MSVEAAAIDTHEHAHSDHGLLNHQFEDLAQQSDAYVVGMWAFLVTEIMFFGALFVAYTVYRYSYPEVFAQAHQHLTTWMGGLNTIVLLTSSYFMALAVHAAQRGWKQKQIRWLVAVNLCAMMFMVVKFFEYKEKYEHHLVPGPAFHYSLPHHGHAAGAESAAEAAKEAPVPGDKAQMFFCLYFAMTGLHGIHVIIGIIVMTVLIIMIRMDHPKVRYYMPTEMAGLYWHFVDIVWIFLFPLYYLIPK